MAVLADKVPYPYMSSKDVLEYVIERLLYKIAPNDGSDFDLRVKKAFKDRFGYDMMEDVNVSSVCLHGTPGVGKTSSVRAAAKEVAAMLGMNFVPNPVPPYFPGDNDLVIATLEMSGEISNIIMGGIPVADTVAMNKGDEESVKFMNKLPLYQLAIMKHAKAKVLLLDDFVNAAPVVQNSALSIALEGRFQMLDLGNPFTVLTANLGSMDNSDTIPLSDPMMGRCGHFYVEDELEDYIDRTHAKFKDGIADASIIGFLKANQDVFIMSPDHDNRAPVNGIRTPYPSPRTWDALIQEMRIYAHSMVASGAQPDARRINSLASARVGKYAAERYASHIYSVMVGADPIARKLIETGVFDEATFKSKYGSGHSDRSHDFGYQFAFSAASHAAAAIAKDDSIENIRMVMGRYGQGIMRMLDPQLILSVSDLGSRLRAICPSLVIQSSSNDKIKHLKTEVVTAIAQSLASVGSKLPTPNIDADLISSITSALAKAKRDGFTNVVKPTPGIKRKTA